MDVGNASLGDIKTTPLGVDNKGRYLYDQVNPEEGDNGAYTGLWSDGGGVTLAQADKVTCYDNVWKLKPSEIPSLQSHCKNYEGNTGDNVCYKNEGKEDFCRYGALRTGIIPFNKVWGLSRFGKGANKGSVPPIFKLISKTIDETLMVTFQVGWYNSNGIWQGFNNIDPITGQSDKTWSRTNTKDDLWSQTDNRVLPGIHEFAEGGGIRVVTQWPAVASDKTIVGEGYTGIKFFMGTSGDETGGLTTNEDLFIKSQF
jgi:hypothetical protein